MAGKSFVGPLVTVLVLAGVGVGGYYAYGHFAAGSSATTQTVPTAVVVRGSLVRTVDSIGELKAARSSPLISPYEGQIVSMVPEGSRVEVGDAVIELDIEAFTQSLQEEEARLALAQKDLESAREEYRLQEIQNSYNLQSEQARVELAEQRLRDAEQRYETEAILVERRISARSRLEEAELAKLQTAVELRNARINLLKTQENLGSNMRVRQSAIDKVLLDIQRIERRMQDFRDRIAQAIMRAPVAGEVTYNRIWRSGSLAKVAEGDSVWARLNLAEIPDRSNMLAVIPVNELDIAAIAVGNTATVVLDAIPGVAFSAKVTRKSIMPIESERQTTTGVAGPREFEVEVAIDHVDPRMFTGMTAAVAVEVARQDGALLVPLEALSMDGEQVGVWTQSGEFVPAKVTLINNRSAAVEGGPKEGDRVALRRPDVRMEEGRRLGFEALRTVREQLRAAAAAAAEAAQAAAAAAAKAAESAGVPPEGEAPRAGRNRGEGRTPGEGRPQRPAGAPAP